MKTKKADKIKAFRLNGNPFVLHDGSLYLISETDYNDIMTSGQASDGSTLDGYESGSLDDINKLMALAKEAQGLIENLRKIKVKVDNMSMFGEIPNLLFKGEPDNDHDADMIEVGCTLITIKDAEAFVKRLNQK